MGITKYYKVDDTSTKLSFWSKLKEDTMAKKVKLEKRLPNNNTNDFHYKTQSLRG